MRIVCAASACYRIIAAAEAGHADLSAEHHQEYASVEGRHGNYVLCIKTLLEKYQYPVLTITLTGDYKIIYQRFLERDVSPDRHRGHVVNDCYPEKGRGVEHRKSTPISYEDYIHGIEQRGFDSFYVGGRQIRVDATDFSRIDMEKIFMQIAVWKEEIS